MGISPIADKISYFYNLQAVHDQHIDPIWRPVAGWPYEVSNLGEVRRTVRVPGTRAGLPIKGGFGGTKRAYPVVLLSDGGTRLWISRHSLVAAAFLGPCPEGHEIHHKDHNPGNPAASNLEYVTSSQNKCHAVANGYHGTRRYNAKLNPDLVREIRRMKTNGHKVSEIAEVLGISESSIFHVLSGRNWRQVQD